jgi:hypothetical protein
MVVCFPTKLTLRICKTNDNGRPRLPSLLELGNDKEKDRIDNIMTAKD